MSKKHLTMIADLNAFSMNNDTEVGLCSMSFIFLTIFGYYMQFLLLFFFLFKEYRGADLFYGTN